MAPIHFNCLKYGPCVYTLFLVLLAGSAPGGAKTLAVVTSTEDLASIAKAVGGDRVNVESMSKGYQDPHFVEAKPSYLLKLRKADLLIAVGLELEVGWLPALVKQSRNPRIIGGGSGGGGSGGGGSGGGGSGGGGSGYLDASLGCEILEKSAVQVTRALGDVHPFGNPHYWLDPHNGRIVAGNIAKKLSDLMPEDATFFTKRLQDFEKTLDGKTKEWKKMMARFAGTKIVTYHNSWPNFAKALGLEVVGFVEPKPGVPPSPSHTMNLIRTMKEQGVRLIIMEPYFDVKTPEAIARETGAKVLVLPPSVGGTKDIRDYFTLFDFDLGLLEKALSTPPTGGVIP